MFKSISWFPKSFLLCGSFSGCLKIYSKFILGEFYLAVLLSNLLLDCYFSATQSTILYDREWDKTIIFLAPNIWVNDVQKSREKTPIRISPKCFLLGAKESGFFWEHLQNGGKSFNTAVAKFVYIIYANLIKVEFGKKNRLLKDFIINCQLQIVPWTL